MVVHVDGCPVDGCPLTVLIIGREGTLVWTLPKRTSPQPTRGDVELRFDITQFV